MVVRADDFDGDGYVDPGAARWSPPAQRSEVEAAADAVMALFEAGILSLRDAVLVSRVARATRIAVGDLRAAHERHLRGEAVMPRSTLAAAVTLGEPFVARRANVGRRRSSMFTPRQPGEPATKRCRRCVDEGRDGELPVEEFLAKWRRWADGTNHMTRASWCHEHRLLYQRDRYLTVDKARRLEMVLLEHDGLVGQGCPECRTAFAVGDEVAGHLGQVRHVECPTV